MIDKINLFFFLLSHLVLTNLK